MAKRKTARESRTHAKKHTRAKLTYGDLQKQNGRVANRMGEAAEVRARKAFLPPDAPSWLEWIRWVDEEGRDAYLVMRDLGEVPIEIKTSFRGAKDFLKRDGHKNTPVVVILHTESDREIRRKLYDAGEAYRVNFFASRR